MSIANLSIGEQVLLDCYLASNAASREGLTPDSMREFNQRWGDVATEARGVDNRQSDALFGGEYPMDLDGMVDFVLGGPGRDRQDPRVSPLHGDLTRLPPTYLQVSATEMLLDDTRRLADAAPDAVHVDVFAGQQHTFQMAAGRSPVADDAVTRIAAWLRNHLEVADQ